MTLSCSGILCNVSDILFHTGGNYGDAAAAARRPGRERYVPAVPRQQRPAPAPRRGPLPSPSQPVCRKGTRGGRHIRPLHGLPGAARGCECFIISTYQHPLNFPCTAHRLKAVRHVQPRGGRGGHRRGRRAMARVCEGGSCGGEGVCSISAGFATRSSDICHPNVSRRLPRGPPPLCPLTRGRKGWKTGRTLRTGVQGVPARSPLSPRRPVAAAAQRQ